MARKYEAVWLKVKTTGKCTVEAHPAFFARVRKAVIKEKNMDLGFKVLNDHDRFYLKIEEVRNEKDAMKSKIRFILKQVLGLEGVKS